MQCRYVNYDFFKEIPYVEINITKKCENSNILKLYKNDLSNFEKNMLQTKIKFNKKNKNHKKSQQIHNYDSNSYVNECNFFYKNYIYEKKMKNDLEIAKILRISGKFCDICGGKLSKSNENLDILHINLCKDKLNSKNFKSYFKNKSYNQHKDKNCNFKFDNNFAKQFCRIPNKICIKKSEKTENLNILHTKQFMKLDTEKIEKINILKTETKSYIQNKNYQYIYNSNLSESHKKIYKIPNQTCQIDNDTFKKKINNIADALNDIKFKINLCFLKNVNVTKNLFGYYLGEITNFDKIIQNFLFDSATNNYYFGGIKNEMFSGNGILLKNDLFFFGNFESGYANGVGLEIYGDKSINIGNWEYNKKHGFFTKISKNIAFKEYKTGNIINSTSKENFTTNIKNIYEIVKNIKILLKQNICLYISLYFGVKMYKKPKNFIQIKYFVIKKQKKIEISKYQFFILKSKFFQPNTHTIKNSLIFEICMN